MGQNKFEFDLAQFKTMFQNHIDKTISVLNSNKALIDSGKSPNRMPCDSTAENSGCGEPFNQCATLTITEPSGDKYTNLFVEHCVLESYCGENPSTPLWIEDGDTALYTCNAIKAVVSATLAAFTLAYHI